jgi:hypothetical protein
MIAARRYSVTSNASRASTSPVSDLTTAVTLACLARAAREGPRAPPRRRADLERDVATARRPGRDEGDADLALVVAQVLDLHEGVDALGLRGLERRARLDGLAVLDALGEHEALHLELRRLPGRLRLAGRAVAFRTGSAGTVAAMGVAVGQLGAVWRRRPGAPA